MLRTIIGTLVGILVAVGVFMGAEQVGEMLYPLPVGLDPADHEAMSAHAEALPVGALVVMLLGWAAGSCGCGVVTRVVSGSRSPVAAYIAGLFLMTAGIVNLFLLPHPIWFRIVGMLVFIPMTLAGHYLAGMRRKN